MTSSSHHHSARASLQSRWHGGAHKAGYGIHAAHSGSATPGCTPRRQPPRDADLAAASAGRLQVQGLVVERPKPIDGVKLKDLVEAKAQGGGNVLGEFGGEAEEEGERAWEEEGEMEERALVDLKGDGRKAKEPSHTNPLG
ncbi:unnamed protein product [Closterium sp. NIES-65]|nr:unnamed protein product [Closterium sp. NIES-65]